jgi:hypothetical protein
VQNIHDNLNLGFPGRENSSGQPIRMDASQINTPTNENRSASREHEVDTEPGMGCAFALAEKVCVQGM